MMDGDRALVEELRLIRYQLLRISVTLDCIWRVMRDYAKDTEGRTG
jgi:hypothetical protein